MACLLSSILKCLLTVINLVLAIGFLALAIIGILLKTSSGFVQSIVTRIFDTVQHGPSKAEVEIIVQFVIDNAGVMCTILIFVGLIVAGLCFVGCISTCCGCECLIKLYAIILAVLLVVQIIGTAVVFSEPVRYTGNMLQAMKSLLDKYGQTDVFGEQATVIWDFTMSFNGTICCGLDGASDFSTLVIAPDAPKFCCRSELKCLATDALALKPPVVGCRKAIEMFATKNMQMFLFICIGAIVLQAALLLLVFGTICVKKASPL